MRETTADNKRDLYSDDDAVQIINNVKAHGKGEVVFSISDGQIRKYEEVRRSMGTNKHK